jgi:hypothetical protein
LELQLLPPAYTHPRAPARARRGPRNGHRPPAHPRDRHLSLRRQGRWLARAARRGPPGPTPRPRRPACGPTGRPVWAPGHDAAHVFVGEEIVAGELQVVQGAPCVQRQERRTLVVQGKREALQNQITTKAAGPTKAADTIIAAAPANERKVEPRYGIEDWLSMKASPFPCSAVR